MTERLLQFIWQFQYFNNSELTTVAGESLQVIFAGHYNIHQGPDFSAARIRIGNTIWAGNVELHLQTTGWEKHHHHVDSNYDNVILHVVWEDDATGNTIPVLELKHRVPGLLLRRYEELMHSGTFIPCENSIQKVHELTWAGWKDRLLAERLIRKATLVQKFVADTNGHWEEAFWWLLARNFGMHVNTEAFDAVARSVPLKILHRHKHQLHQLEALLLGQAGLLEGRFTETYPQLLQREYNFLKRKTVLGKVHTPMLFLRMRPGNFPTIRLAQLAMLIHTTAHLFTKIKEAVSLKEVKQCFDIVANDYWHYHYLFDKPTSFKKKSLGAAMIDNIIINTVCPVLFAYGSYQHEQAYKDKALQWLSQTDAELSAVIRGFRQLGITIKDAADSQALLELKSMYCDRRGCLDCSVGNAIVKGSEKLK